MKYRQIMFVNGHSKCFDVNFLHNKRLDKKVPSRGESLIQFRKIMYESYLTIKCVFECLNIGAAYITILLTYVTWIYLSIISEATL